MQFEQLKEFIKDFPKLNKAYQVKVGEGYTITSISARSLCPERSLDIKSIEIHMENTNGKRIVINFYEGTIKFLYIDEIPSGKGIVYDNMVLNKEMIHEKDFKKKLFGGYDDREVNVFLDLIISDYKYMELLQKENKILREDIKKFRDK